LIRIKDKQARQDVRMMTRKRQRGERPIIALHDRKDVLEARLRELTGRLLRIAAELDQPANKDFEERATEQEGTEVLEDLGAAGKLEIRMIEAALGRIADGSYGTCVQCGEPIGEARLDVLPHTPKCRACAQAH
jgi:RNA polymerase-binding transcription factor DksA